MTDQMDGRDGSERGKDEGFGDDQGARVGPPTPKGADQPGHLGVGHTDGGAAQRPRVNEGGAGEEKTTGAGAEASEGMHAADGARDESDRTALDGKATGRGEGKDGGRSGSEPQSSHDHEHSSRYGGAGGEEKKGY